MAAECKASSGLYWEKHRLGIMEGEKPTTVNSGRRSKCDIESGDNGLWFDVDGGAHELFLLWGPESGKDLGLFRSL